ncbi:MAG: L-rhamnose mutarotase [Lachnospiraceae bacterium]
MRRYGQIIRLKPEYQEEYIRLHSDVPADVNAVIKSCNISNYSIYLWNGLLFAYMEYTGEDFDADMRKMGASAVTQNWWSLTDPCQESVSPKEANQWWTNMDEVYHLS